MFATVKRKVEVVLRYAIDPTNSRYQWANSMIMADDVEIWSIQTSSNEHTMVLGSTRLARGNMREALMGCQPGILQRSS